MAGSKFIFCIGVHLLLVLHSLGYIEHNFTLGRIKGRTLLSRNHNKFYAFLGVPYAQPPIGDLRFQNPVLYNEPWSDTYDATREQKPCSQFKSRVEGYRGSEDCLYLNLYIPQSPQNITQKLPVWYFIYPGKRLFGEPSSTQYGPHYIMDHPVIFISASYRVGTLGFLSTEDDIIKGNFGLKDQNMVLQWIHRYISDFGGDPNRVTISGESSGAVDVWLHLFSPLSSNLFHRAISESGQALNYRSLPEPGNALKQTWKVARIVGCYNESIKKNEDLLSCLKNVEAKTLTLAFVSLLHDYVLPHTLFGVVIEKEEKGAFLVSHPAIDIQKPNNKSVLMGVVPDEGKQKVIPIFGYPSPKPEFREKVRQHFFKNYRALFPQFFGINHLLNEQQVLDALMDKYCQNELIENTFYCVSEIVSYGLVHLGMTESARIYRGLKYYYVYDHLNKIPFKKVYDTSFGFKSQYKFGVIHGEEMRSLFYGPQYFPPVIEGDDRIVSDQVVELFANFVIHGDPNGERKEKLWKPVTTPDVEYLYIHNLTLTPQIKPYWDQYQFWKSLHNPTLMSLKGLKKQYDQHLLFPQHEKLKKELQTYL